MNKHSQLPYTYLIGWSTLDCWYYGSRSANKVPPADDLMVKYKTSSRVVKEFIKIHGMPDIVKVRKTFESKEQAESYEGRVLTKIGARDSDRWLNQSNNSFPHVSYQWTDEHRAKISAARKGRKHSEETRAKMSAAKRKMYLDGAPGANKGRILSDEWKENVRQSRLGKPSPTKGMKLRPRSEETKQKIAAAVKAHWESKKSLS